MSKVSKYFFTIYLLLIIQVEDAQNDEKFLVWNHGDTEILRVFSVSLVTPYVRAAA